MHILGEMSRSLDSARETVSEHAPRITTFTIPRDKIREVIGTGGKIIREICEVTGAKIDIDDDGTIKVAAVDSAAGGAIVAIAAGNYFEDVDLDKPVRLWGRCPSMVNIYGSVVGVWVRSGASGSEIRDLAINDPFYTYCINHPHRIPWQLRVPIGPVFKGDSTGHRRVWAPAPDNEQVRSCLLDLIRGLPESGENEYPIGLRLGEVILSEVVQLEDLRSQLTLMDKVTAALAAFVVPAGMLIKSLGVDQVHGGDVLTVIFPLRAIGGTSAGTQLIHTTPVRCNRVSGKGVGTTIQ